LPTKNSFFILEQNGAGKEAVSMKLRPQPWLLAALFVLTGLAALFDPLHRGLQGSYFLGPDLSREPNLITREKKIGLDRMRLEYPGRAGKISILWKGSLYVSAAGEHTFALTSGPGSEFQIDGVNLISGPPAASETREARIDLERGFHPVQILFFQVPVRGQFDFRWAPPGKPLGGLESALLFAEAPRSAAALTVYRIRRILLPPLLAACVFFLAAFLTRSGSRLDGRFLPRVRSRAGLDLLAFLLLNGFALNIFLSLFCEKTVLDFSRFFITSPVHSGEDSWRQMAAGLDYLSSPHERTLYAEVFFAQKNKFQYPPTSLLFLEPLRWLPYPKMVVAANLISWLATIAGAFLLGLILMRGLPRPPGEDRFSPREKAVLLIAALGFTLTFYPLLKSFEVGQVQTWLYFLFVLALWFWLSGKKFLSGALIGLICLVKPQLGLFALWGLLRRERRFAAGLVSTAGIVGLISLALFGWANHLDYLRALSYMGKHGESYYTNQSVNGLVNRLLFNGTILHGNPRAFAPYNVWVFVLTLATTAVLIAVALFWKRGRDCAARNEDFLTAAVAFTMASPIAWEHHYSILLPVFAAALPAVLAPRGRRGMIWVLAAAFALSANIYPFVNSLANTRFNFLLSALFFGALALLVLLYRLRTERSNAAAEPGQDF
jgi:alpha-1,2-mannosyltransferase